MHGDLGRTVPNLGGILSCEVDIIALDVEVSKEVQFIFILFGKKASSLLHVYFFIGILFCVMLFMCEELLWKGRVPAW